MKTNNPYGVAPNAVADLQTQYAPEKNTGLAIISLIFGILSFFLLLFSAIPGIITGHMALSRAKKHSEEYGGETLAIIGLVLSYLMLILSLGLIAWFTYMFTSIPGFAEGFNEVFQQGMQESIDANK